MPEHCHDIEPLGSAYLDGALPPATAAVVEAHLGGCTSCRGELDALARTRAMLRSLPVRRVPAELLADVPADAGDVALPVPPPPIGPEVDQGLQGVDQRVEQRGTVPPGSGSPSDRGVGRRSFAVALAVAGVLGGAAFTLGEEPPATRTVAVPVDIFVADHLVQTRSTPVWTPLVLEASR